MRKSAGVTSFKPILPKITNSSVVITRKPVEVTPQKLCFVCDGMILGSGTPMLSTTPKLRIDLPSKIGHIMGDKFMVIVSEDDVLCKKCYGLILHVENLENDLENTKKTLTDHLKHKYSLEDRPNIVADAEPTIVDTDIQEFVVVNDGEMPERVEPEAKKLRPIQPKTTAPLIQLFTCTHCNFVTVKAEEFMSHQLECKTTLMYKCTMCEKRFDTRRAIKVHKMKAHLSTWTCHFCNLSFTDGYELMEHMQQHLGDKSDMSKPENVIKYKCEVCNETFNELSSLQSHVLNHENMVTYKCVHCDFVSNLKDDFIRHVTTSHTLSEATNQTENELQIKDDLTISDILTCTQCGLNFVQQSLFDQHLASHELGQVIDDTKESLSQDTSTGEDENEMKFLQIKNEEYDEDVLNLFQVSNDQSEENTETNCKTFVCADCSFSTTDIILLEKHFMHEHKMSEFGSCEKIEISDELVENKTVKNDVKKMYSCQFCNEEFVNKKAVTLHEHVHPESKTAKCPDCEEVFSNDKLLNEHREISHAVSRCRFCTKTFPTLKQIKTHEARHLNVGKKEFICSYCDKRFQTQTGLKHHEPIHTGDFTYICEFCDKGFVSRVSYLEHRASHTKEERYSCELCGKKFSFQATYWIHRKWHDNPFPYKCEFCGRQFKHTSLLSVHRRKHTGDRPYRCHLCDQTFAVGNTLKRHLMLHTGQFPYVCNDCEKGFTAKHKLAIHMSKIHHNDILLQKQMERKNRSDFKMIVQNTDEVNVINPVTENNDDNSQQNTLQMENVESLLTDINKVNTAPVVELCFKDLGQFTNSLSPPELLDNHAVKRLERDNIEEGIINKIEY